MLAIDTCGVRSRGTALIPALLPVAVSPFESLFAFSSSACCNSWLHPKTKSAMQHRNIST